MISRIAFALLAGALALAPQSADAQLKVVTSTSDLYDIAEPVGGDRIVATHIGEGYQDPHFIEAMPRFVLQLRNADVWAFVGLDLEIGWMPLLLDGARNPKIRQGDSGYVDASRALKVLDAPHGDIDRSMGDVHALGNPHYWLDPENGRRIARLFKAKFSQLDPKNEDAYEKNEKAFEARLDAAEQGWAADPALIRGYFTVSIVSAVIAAVVGFSLSVPFDLPSGPAIIAISGALALLAWPVRLLQRRG